MAQSKNKRAVPVKGEYKAIAAGLAEADEIFGVVVFAKLGDDNPRVVEMKAMFYIFKDGELLSSPIAGCDVTSVGLVLGKNRYFLVDQVTDRICRAVATKGINVYEVRDQTLDSGRLLNNEYDGPVRVYGDAK